MQNKADSTISSKQLIFIIVGSQIGMGMFSLPRLVTGKTGKDAWIAVILGAIIPLISVYLIERLGSRMPDLGFTRMTQALFGNAVGSLLVILFIAYIIFFESIVVRIFAEVTKLYILSETPLAVILFMYLMVILYIGGKGARVIARINELTIYLLFLVILILLVPLAQSDYTNLLPVGKAGPLNIASGALTTAYYFAGTEILFVFYTLVTNKQEVLKAACSGVLITMILYLLIVLTAELVFGVNALQKIVWPGLVLLKVVQIPLLERLEFIFLFFWLGMGARPALNMCFAASLSLSQLLNINVPKNNIYSLLFIGLILYVGALVPHDILVVFKLADYAGYGFFAIGLVYPLLLHMALLMRGGKVEMSA